MRFWDTSSIVPLLVKENSTAAMQSLYRSDFAFLAAEKDPSTLDFVCLDERLVNAARKEGFAVIGI